MRCFHLPPGFAFAFISTREMMAIRKLCVMPLWHYPLWHPNLKLHLLNFDCCHLFVCFFQLGHYEFRRHRWPTSSSMWIKVGPCYGPTIIYQMNMMLRYKGLSNERVRSMRSQTEWEVGQFSYRPCRPVFQTENWIHFIIQHLKNKLKAYRGPVLWSVDFHLFASPMFQLSLQGPDAGCSLVKLAF